MTGGGGVDSYQKRRGNSTSRGLWWERDWHFQGTGTQGARGRMAEMMLALCQMLLKGIIHVNSFSLYNNPKKEMLCDPYFTYEESEPQRD